MEETNQDYYARLEKENTKALWQLIGAESPAVQEPRPLAQPHIWKWQHIYPLLEEAIGVMKAVDANDELVKGAYWC